MQRGGHEKLLWGTGCTVTHPQHLLELMCAFAFSPETCDRHGIPPIDDAVKRLILGGNYARMIGTDTAALAAAQAGDAFDTRPPLQPPWSVWTAQ